MYISKTHSSRKVLTYMYGIVMQLEFNRHIHVPFLPTISPRTIKGKLKKNAFVISLISLHSLAVYMTSEMTIFLLF